MTTMWPKQPGGAIADERSSAAPTLVPPAGTDGPVVSPARDDDPQVVFVARPSRSRRRSRRRRPAHRRRSCRPSALLALLVLPLAVALTVAAMTLLPAPESGRAGSGATVLGGVTVEVLDAGVGSDLVTLVADRLAEAGAEVVTGGRAAGGGGDNTQVVYRDPAAREKAAEVRRTLRVGKVVFDRSRSSSMEVSIVVGTDLRNA